MDAVTSLPRYQTPFYIKSLLGLANYYERFVLVFFSIASSLTTFNHEKDKFIWS